jgi:putative ABC transport system permease protein
MDWLTDSLMDWLTDVRYAWRQLVKSPTFSATAAITLAVGIGSTTTAFAIARGVLWRPLPFADSGRLTALWEADAQHSYGNRNEVSFADFLEWRDAGEASGDFDHLTALANRNLTLTGAGDPEQLQGAAPSVDFFEMLGVRPAIGRAFTRDEERPEAPPTALISDGLWMRRFGGDPQLLGRTIALSGTPTTVIGVLPAGFRFEFPTRRDIDVWVPRIVTPEAREARRSRGLYVVGHLSPGVSATAAQARLSAVMARLAAAHPLSNGGWDVRFVPLQDQIAGTARTPLVVLLAAAACLLLIVCANLGTLMLVRASARQGEMAVRAAIGATAGRLLRQLLVESAVIAVIGGAAGALLASWSIAAIRSGALGINLPRLHELQVDWEILAFALALALGSSVAFGLVPARQAIARDDRGLNSPMRGAASRGSTRSARRQSVLAAAEVALAVLLLISSGLLFKSLMRLQQVDPGFDPRGVLTFQVSLPARSYGTPRQIGGFYEALIAQVSGLPGVTAAGAVTNLPLAGSDQTSSVSVEGSGDRSTRAPEAAYRAATPGYFNAMKMRLLRGRAFDAHDAAAAPAVAIINETMARRFWPGDDPLGRRLKFGQPDAALPWTTVVGIVGDVRHAALQADPEPEIYVPQAQDPSMHMYAAVRSNAPPAALARAIGAQVRAIDKTLPIFKVEPLDDIVDAAIAAPRLNARLIGAFGVIAVLLAVGGTYGVIAYSMSRRTREIGVRLALGATARDVMRLLVGGGALTTGAGAMAGAGAALVLTRLFASMLFGVTARDPAIFVAAPLALIAIALAACVLPAWRATRIDPATILRAE